MSTNIVPYNSELEKQLFASLTVKPSVRFHADVVDTERRQKRKHVRDSQHNRESTGRPGSRRHTRHQNKMELIDKALSDSESELEIEVELNVQSRSPFTILFEDENVKERWEPFIEITEEDQSTLLSELYAEPSAQRQSKKKSQFSTNPKDCFNMLRREEKKLLKKQTGNSLIEKMEESIIDFIMSRRTTMSLLLQNDFSRMIFNCCCVYYNVFVSADEQPDGSIREILRKPKGAQLPSTKLSAYLKQLKQQEEVQAC